MTQSRDAERQFLRHTAATVAYRGGKAVRNAPEHFAHLQIGPTSRTPALILAHIGNIFDWALSLAKGRPEWHDTPPLQWEEEVERFHAGIQRFDDFLNSDEPLACSAETLFQGPIADALTHVGQLAMLRRLAGSPVRGENYFKADIVAGRVGAEQSLARREFD